MKTDLQLVEECIEEKTKEYYRAVAFLKQVGEIEPLASFQTQQLMGSFEARQAVSRIRSELDILLSQRAQLTSDITEKELITGSRDKILECLTQLSDGLYRLVKIEREDNGSE